MYECKNCSTTTEDFTERCPTCSMPGMLEEKVEAKDPQVKQIYKSCKNCGTLDIGSGPKCQVCNFPVSVPRTKTLQDAKTKRS